MTGTLLFLGLGMQEVLFIALIVLLWKEDTRTDERSGQRSQEF